MYTLKNTLNEELRQIEFLLDRISVATDDEIPGNLKCRCTREGLTYYLRTGNSTKKLGGPDHPVVQRKKKSAYRKKLLKILRSNKKAISDLLQVYQEYGPKDVDATLPFPYQDLPANCFQHPAVSVTDDYDSEDIVKSTQATTVHITVDGTPVRSKSEVIIYNLLVYYGIPFVYEKTLYLKDASGYKQKVRPDFTIFLADGSIVIIEHFGMLDDPKYAESAFRKIETYFQNNICLGERLIITCDNANHEFDCRYLECILREYILPRVNYNTIPM